MSADADTSCQLGKKMKKKGKLEKLRSIRYFFGSYETRPQSTESETKRDKDDRMATIGMLAENICIVITLRSGLKLYEIDALDSWTEIYFL